MAPKGPEGRPKLHDWLEAQIAERQTEPNSGLGKAIKGTC